jgi:predicted transcriptional regulator
MNELEQVPSRRVLARKEICTAPEPGIRSKCESVRTILNDDYGHKVPAQISCSITTTPEDKLPRIGQESIKLKILEYLFDVKQAFVSDIAWKLQKKNSTVRKIISRLRKLGFVRTGLDWKIKITDAGSLYYILYKDRDRERRLETVRDIKGKIKEKKKQHQLNFNVWAERRPYLSQEGVRCPEDAIST